MGTFDGRHNIAAEGWPRLQQHAVFFPNFQASAICGQTGVNGGGHIRDDRPTDGGSTGENHLGFLLSDHLLQNTGINILAKLLQQWVFSKKNGISAGSDQIIRIGGHCTAGQNGAEFDPALIGKFAANAQQFITDRRDLTMAVFSKYHDSCIRTNVGLCPFFGVTIHRAPIRTIVHASTAKRTGFVDHSTISPGH
jgi:hypothetical protein